MTLVMKAEASEEFVAFANNYCLPPQTKFGKSFRAVRRCLGFRDNEKDIINAALNFTAWVVEERERGMQVAAVNPETGSVVSNCPSFPVESRRVVSSVSSDHQ